ncbi:hypothetical protein LguiA_029887 [Lonicera macranthoides]
MFALFPSMIFGMPNPPSDLGRKISNQASFEAAFLISTPSQRNFVKTTSMSLRTALGIIKILLRYM